MKASRRHVRSVAILIAASSCLMSGCVRETARNGERLFQYDLWEGVLILMAAFLVIPLGLVLRKKFPRSGWSLALLGPAVLAYGSTPSFLDRVVIGPNAFHSRSGLWGFAAVHTLEFDQIEAIRISTEHLSTRGHSWTNFYLNCDMKSGKSVKISVNTPMLVETRERIVQAAMAHGVPIVVERGEP